MMRSPFKSFVVGLVLALVGGIWAIGSYIYVVFEKPISPNPEGSSILLIPRGTPYSQVKKELQELGLAPTCTPCAHEWSDAVLCDERLHDVPDGTGMYWH